MRFLWVDTETTGLNVTDSAAFEVAMILVENGKTVCERLFWLNPLGGAIKYHEEAGKVHGYSEEDIRKFPPESEMVPKIAAFLEDAREGFQKDGSRSEKLIAAGYNVGFDTRHLDALLSRNGYSLGDYVDGQRVADVFVQVMAAGAQRALPYLPDRKLGTVAKHLGVDLANAHDALADIRATRQVALKLHTLGVKLI